MDWDEINSDRSHPNSIILYHGIFAITEDELEYTSSSSTTSFTFEEELEMTILESFAFEREENAMDPLIYCSPRYFAFTRGTYDLRVGDLLFLF